MPRVPPEVLMYKLDDWADGDPRTNDFNPGKYNKQPLKLIAKQFNRRLLFFRRTKNWIYQIGSSREIVYKPFPKSAGVMLMGISMKSMWWHPKSVSMEHYAKYFIDKIDPDWIKRNDFEFV